MEVSQFLTLLISEEKEQYFFEKLIEKATKNGWKKVKPRRWGSDHFFNFDQKLMDIGPYTELYIQFESKNIPLRNEVLEGDVLFFKNNGYYKVSVIDIKYSEFNDDDYFMLSNYFLNFFYKEQLSEISKELNVKIFFSKREKSIFEIVGNESSKLLKIIFEYSDKTMGIDGLWDQWYWRNFIIKVYVNKIRFNNKKGLIDTFAQEGWSHEFACEIVNDLYRSLSLLKEYDLLLSSSKR